MRLTDRSPDLNPVRHLWDIMYRCIALFTVAASFCFKSDWCPNPDLGGVPPAGDHSWPTLWALLMKFTETGSPRDLKCDSKHSPQWFVFFTDCAFIILSSKIYTALIKNNMWSIKTAWSRAWCKRFCFLAVFVSSLCFFQGLRADLAQQYFWIWSILCLFAFMAFMCAMMKRSAL